jgi:hypothetical protein
MTEENHQWLLDSAEPWTRYRTQLDLLDHTEAEPEVQVTRAGMVTHPAVQAVIAACETWPGYPLKRHNDAKHPLYKFSTLADFGIRANDPGMKLGVDALKAHQSQEGPFQTLINIPKAFGGTDEDVWTWVSCDAPTIIYTLLSMNEYGDKSVKGALDYLVRLVEEKGWHCRAAPELGKFRGPGRKTDPCPIVNLYMLKALSLLPDLLGSPAANAGIDMLLGHWERQEERKLYLFGIGTDFRKLKYPFVWYDILHVVEVLSRYPQVHGDPRFMEMVETITGQADDRGRYTANSMYMAWKGWSFADKKTPSPWLTFLVMRILKRISNAGSG